MGASEPFRHLHMRQRLSFEVTELTPTYALLGLLSSPLVALEEKTQAKERERVVLVHCLHW